MLELQISLCLICYFMLRKCWERRKKTAWLDLGKDPRFGIICTVVTGLAALSSVNYTTIPSISWCDSQVMNVWYEHDMGCNVEVSVWYIGLCYMHKREHISDCRDCKHVILVPGLIYLWLVMVDVWVNGMMHFLKLMHSGWDVSLARYVTFYMLIHVLNNTTISGCMCVRIEWLLVGTDKWLFLLMTGFLSWPALHRTAPLWKLLPPDEPLLFISTSVLSHWGTWQNPVVPLAFASP